MKWLARIWPGIALIAVCAGVVQLCVHLKWVNAAILPPPGDVALAWFKLLTRGEMYEPAVYTVTLLFAGWLLACVAGVVLGVAMGLSRRIYNLLDMLVELIRPIPKPALVPPLMLLLGLGAAMETAIVFLGAFFPILIATVQGVRGVDPVKVDVARTLRVGRGRVLALVILPESLPMIMSGMKVGLALAIVLAVLAEMLTGSGGLGARIVEMQTSYRSRELYAWVLLVALLGFVIVYGFEYLEKRIVFWQQER